MEKRTCPQTRTCPKCGLTKSVSAFTKTDHWCKDCRMVHNRDRYTGRPPLEDAFEIRF